jgi:hypothetical protein
VDGFVGVAIGKMNQELQEFFFALNVFICKQFEKKRDGIGCGFIDGALVPDIAIQCIECALARLFVPRCKCSDQSLA